MLEVNQLTKSFGNRIAVDHLNFKIASGEVLCLLGANGAGDECVGRSRVYNSQVIMTKRMTHKGAPADCMATVASLSLSSSSQSTSILVL